MTHTPTRTKTEWLNARIEHMRAIEAAHTAALKKLNERRPVTPWGRRRVAAASANLWRLRAANGLLLNRLELELIRLRHPA